MESRERRMEYFDLSVKYFSTSMAKRKADISTIT